MGLGCHRLPFISSGGLLGRLSTLGALNKNEKNTTIKRNNKSEYKTPRQLSKRPTCKVKDLWDSVDAFARTQCIPVTQQISEAHI